MPETVAYWEIDEESGDVKEGGYSMNGGTSYTNWDDE